MQELKCCKECKRNLPMNTDYFFKKNGTQDGFANKCKECQGYKFTNKLTKIPKDGYKFCAKCKQELASDIKFFPPDKACKDGLRNVCRECGNDGHFMTDKYVKKPRRVWSDEENKLFTERYPHYSNRELIEIFYPNETIKKLMDRATRLSVNKSEETMKRLHKIHSEKMYGVDSPLYGLIRSEETKRKISESIKGKYVGENSYWYGRKRSEDQCAHISKIKKGKWSGESNPRVNDPLIGERNGRWQGGITAENAKIRNSEEYSNWRISVFQRDMHACQCCGNKNNLEAHHILNFSNNEDLRFDINNGMTLCHDCHNPIVKDSFHHVYGTRNNTYEQLSEFMTGISWSIETKRKVVLEAVI